MDTVPAPHRGHESPAHESLAQQQRRSRTQRLGREVRPRSDRRHGVASQAGVGAPPNRYRPKLPEAILSCWESRPVEASANTSLSLRYSIRVERFQRAV